MIPLGLSDNGDGPGLSTHRVYFFNSQLWGELRRTIMQKGLQSVAPSPCASSERLLSPSSLFHIYNNTLTTILADSQKKV